MKRDKSIIQPNMDRCFICGSTYNLHIHEIFYGTANRANSIKYGCYCKLCAYHHNTSNNGVHYNKALDLHLKKFTQMKFEEIYGHDKFMQVFKRSYLWANIEI